MIAYAIRAILLASATAAAKMQFRDFGRKAAVLCARQNNGRVAATAVRHNPPAQRSRAAWVGFSPFTPMMAQMIKAIKQRALRCRQ